MSSSDTERSRLTSISDVELESQFDDISASLVASRYLSLVDLDALTDSLALAAKSDWRSKLEAQVQMLMDQKLACLACAYDDKPREPPGPGWSNADVNLPQSGLTHTGRHDLRPDDAISIHGLTTTSELNSLAGVVVTPGYEAVTGLCSVHVHDQTGRLLALQLPPRNLLLTSYARDDTAVAFLRPRFAGWDRAPRAHDGHMEQRSVRWCRCNGFDEVDAAARLWAGPWWEALQQGVRRAAIDRACGHWQLIAEGKESILEEAPPRAALSTPTATLTAAAAAGTTTAVDGVAPDSVGEWRQRRAQAARPQPPPAESRVDRQLSLMIEAVAQLEAEYAAMLPDEVRLAAGPKP